MPEPSRLETHAGPDSRANSQERRFLEIFWEDSQLNICAGRLAVRPPCALTSEAVVSRAYGKPDANRLRCSGVVIEQPTETLVSTHSTDTPFRRLAVKQVVVRSRMIPLAMIVDDNSATARR